MSSERSVSVYRLDIGVEILTRMVKEGEFPMPYKDALTDRMMEYFYMLGYEDELNKQGSSWLPTSEYWGHRMKELQKELRKRSIYLEGEVFVGNWDVCSKDEFEDRMKIKHADCNTRLEGYNDKVTDGNKKWQSFNLPLGEPIRQLEN